MNDQIITIAKSILSGLAGIWPYLLITIPISVAVQMSGAAKYINKALSARPAVAILLATLVGAFSPFCSCGVIPVIATLLIAGVPLGPVMSFWIASPSMDPEIFFLSAASLGWDLAVWRLFSTLLLSLSAGFITHYIVRKGWLGKTILRTREHEGTSFIKNFIKNRLDIVKNRIKEALSPRRMVVLNNAVDVQAMCCTPVSCSCVENSCTAAPVSSSCSGCSESSPELEKTTGCGCSAASVSDSFSKQLAKETWKATTLVMKFMVLSFVLKELVALYVPAEVLRNLLGKGNPLAILNAALIGVPMYTGNLAAMPLIGGLLNQGMDPAAALAFLIAGPVTTIPAMAAVWGITNRRVFALYVSFAFFGALVFGYLYRFIHIF
jgi:uncharacterized protein